jgi:hypothetical protein
MEQELIDGNPVVSHVVRFKDRTTITDRDAEAVRDGAVVVWIVRTVCEPPSYHPVAKDSDDRYRFNIQDVKSAAVLHGELREGALAYLDDPTQTQGRFVFDAPLYNGDPGPAEITTSLAFEETGEGWLDGDGWREIPLPDLPDSAYPPGGTPLEVSLLTDEPVADDEPVSIYGEGGSDTQKLLAKWDEL